MLLFLSLAATAIPLGSPSGWFAASDYPSAAIRNGSEGRVTAELTVSPTGLSTSCKIVEAAKEEALNESTCHVLLERARFRPAEHESGPNASYRVTVAWRLPDMKLDRTASGSLAQFRISNEGRMLDCRETLFGDTKFGEGGQCEAFEGGDVRNLESFLGGPLLGATSGAIRIYIVPSEQADIEVFSQIPSLHYAVLGEAIVDVTPAGRVANCKSKAPKLAIPGDLCSALTPGEQMFQPSKRASQMKVLVDLWVK